MEHFAEFLEICNVASFKITEDLFAVLPPQ
jgi:hypothetical protein